MNVFEILVLVAGIAVGTAGIVAAVNAIRKLRVAH